MTSQINTHHHNNSHTPVLLQDVVRVLAPRQGESYLDLTAGYGGHARAILDVTGDASIATLVDRDASAVSALKPLIEQGAQLIHMDFAAAAEQLAREGRQFDMILADLGVSSPHLDNGSRGFSFMYDAPLDMRMDPRQELSAEVLVNSRSEAELMEILRTYGDEPKARSIARAIVDSRPVTTTGQLADIVSGVYGRRGKTHPATRTFQAIRIAVNDELGQLERLLKTLPELLTPGGRVAIISFHSLEDRLVKRYFAEEAKAGYEAQLKILTKKPISGKSELVFNPRARSAMLRGAVKIKREKG